MKTRFLMIIALFASVTLFSCQKESQEPQIVFANNTMEGKASNGEYNLTGIITSEVKLQKVTLTVEGQTTPFLVDESTASNKLEYEFTYLITGITADTYVVIDVYDQEGGKRTTRFLIRA